MSEATSKKIIRNTIYTSAWRFWALLLSFVLTPYIISKIGIERFGIWTLVNVVVDFFLYFDMGIGSSFVKYIAEYNAQKNYSKVNQVINTGIIFCLLFCFFILILLILLKDFLIGLFNFSHELHQDFTFAFFGILAVFIINYLFTVFRSVINGLQRMDITNLIYIIVSIPGTIGLVLFLQLGYGLKGLVLNSIIVTSITVIACTIYAYRLLPEMTISLRHFNKEMFTRLWKFGFKVQVADISEFINLQLDKVLLGHFINVKMITFYELGSKIANTAGKLPSALLPAIEPASSELDAAKDTRALNNLYTRGTKYLVLIAFPLALFVIVNASPIMHFWMGKSGYEKSALAIQILTIGYLTFLVNNIGRMMARGIGVPQFEMVSALIILGLNILLSITLIILFGFIGALIGTSVSAVIGSLYFMNRFHKHIERTITTFLREVYLKPFFACIFAILASLLIDLLFYFLDFSPSGRFGYFVYLGLKGFIFSGMYLLCIYITRYLDEYDKNVFLSAIKMPLSKLGFIKK